MEREDKKNKRQEEGGEGEADKHIEPGLEHPGGGGP